MFTELVEYGRKLDEKMKAMLSEGKETGTQINSVDKKEERNIQPEKNEKNSKKWKEH